MNTSRITVQRLTQDELAGQEWLFWYYDDAIALVIDTYRTMERKSKRHKFQSIDNYNRLEKRYSSLEETNVPLPPDVAKEALDTYVSKMRVCRWADRYNRK